MVFLAKHGGAWGTLECTYTSGGKWIDAPFVQQQFDDIFSGVHRRYVQHVVVVLRKKKSYTNLHKIHFAHFATFRRIRFARDFPLVGKSVAIPRIRVSAGPH